MNRSKHLFILERPADALRPRRTFFVLDTWAIARDGELGARVTPYLSTKKQAREALKSLQAK